MWAFEDDFDTYSDGDLNGQGSWSGNAAFDVQGSVVHHGTKAVSLVLSNDVTINSPSFTSAANGTAYVSMRATNVSMAASSGGMVSVLKTAADTAIAYIGLVADKLRISINGGVWADTGISVVANIWYRIAIAFETGAGGWEGLAADTYKVSIDNGASWSGAESLVASSGVEKLTLAVDGPGGSGTGYWDFISPDYAKASSSFDSLLLAGD